MVRHRRIVALRDAGMSIARTAELAGCSIAQVKRVTAAHRQREAIKGMAVGTPHQSVNLLVRSK